MKLHEFFFFLQAHAENFFSSSISCMNFFFGSDTPPPRISNGPPLIAYTHVVKRVRAKFSKNCAFCDRTIIFIVRFDFGMRTDII